MPTSLIRGSPGEISTPRCIGRSAYVLSLLLLHLIHYIYNITTSIFILIIVEDSLVFWAIICICYQAPDSQGVYTVTNLVHVNLSHQGE